MNMRVEVGHATPEKQIIITLSVDDGITAQDAILQSNILSYFPDAPHDLTQSRIGIFGKIVSLSHILLEGDRVEIYRSLIADPKQARKTRANTTGVIPTKKAQLK